MNKLKSWANNRGLGVGNLVVFLVFVTLGAVVSVMPHSDEDYDLNEDDELTAEEILEGLRDGTYISVRNDQGGNMIYKKIGE